MRWFLLAALLVTLAGCEYRYEGVATDSAVYVIDKQTGQVLRPQIGYAGYSNGTGWFGPLPKYVKTD